MTENWTNEIILEFLEVYEKYPVIWDLQNENNKNRRMVANAWNDIINEMSVECTVETLKRKKESLMATYRFIKKKLFDSQKSGEVYKPSWFAFSLMDRFLRNAGKTRQSCNTEDTETEPDEILKETEVSELKTEEVIVQIHTPVVKSKRKILDPSFGMIDNANAKKACDALQTIAKAQENLQDKPDECEIYGQLVAAKLRTISKRSRLILMNQIDNVIFETQLKEMDSDPLEN